MYYNIIGMRKVLFKTIGSYFIITCLIYSQYTQMITYAVYTVLQQTFLWGCLLFLFVERNHLIMYKENNKIETTKTEVGRRFRVTFPPLISPCLYGVLAVCVARLCVIFQFPFLRGARFFSFVFFLSPMSLFAFYIKSSMYVSSTCRRHCSHHQFD